MVSKATKRHCAGTVQSQGGRVRNVKQVGFEPGTEYNIIQYNKISSAQSIWSKTDCALHCPVRWE